jgi:hypothetical protein
VMTAVDVNDSLLLSGHHGPTWAETKVSV